MIAFLFKVNKSFLNSRFHPITVPRSQVDYADLKRNGLDRGDLAIECPNGRTLSGQMYSGKAGFGIYYQIKIDGSAHDPLSQLSHGAYLAVTLKRDQGKRIARLRLADPRELSRLVDREGV